MSTEIDLPPPPPPLPADDRGLSVPDAEFNSPGSDRPERVCPNCGAPVHGPFCYACGQSEKGMIRHLSEVLSDLADIVLNVDSRIFRSLWDLYIRPGFLTTEYLAGRRARYVTPFRLFFFLTIIAFFAMQASIGPGDFRIDGDDSIEDATTVEQVTNKVDETITALTTARNAPLIDAEEREKIDAKIARVRNRGESRLFELKLEGATSPKDVASAVDEAVALLASGNAAISANAESRQERDGEIAELRALGDVRMTELKEDAAALAAGKPLPDHKRMKGEIQFFDIGGKPWHAQENPVAVDWWPQALNSKLNSTMEHMESNIRSAQKDPMRLVMGWFSVLPQTLFVVMPLFAVLLKVFYLFKRRLYMEHLLVALHSHAFIFMSTLVLLFLWMLAGLAKGLPVLLEVIEWLSVAAWVWLFAYLLIMQKRVYRQGWFMTVVKYCAIGVCYTIFLGASLLAAALVTLALT